MYGQLLVVESGIKVGCCAGQAHTQTHTYNDEA